MLRYSWLLLILPCYISVGNSAQASELHRIQQQIEQTAPTTSLLVLLDAEGRELYRYGTLNEFIPASTIKIATALAALRVLGENYRFTTNLYLDKNLNLLVQGTGDPMLVSEEITAMAGQLKALGYSQFRSIELDDSAVAWQQAPGTASGEDPYDAANGGLIVNFNTVFVEKTNSGTVRSAEQQTPLTQVARDLVKNKPPGRYRINIGPDRQLSLAYSREIIGRLLHRAGIATDDELAVEPGIGSQTRLLLSYRNSHQLTELVRLMLKYSNNYIANQTGLALMPQQSITIEDAAAHAEQWLEKNLGLSAEDLSLEEFSGISRNNRISVNAMIRLLEEFKEYAHLLESEGAMLVKSGSLDGIYNYAGYLRINQQLWPVIIVTYTKTNNRDQLLQLMQQLGQDLASK